MKKRPEVNEVEFGRHIDDNPNVIYVVQVIKFYDRTFDTGTVVKEFELKRGRQNIFNFKLPPAAHRE